MSAHAQLSFVSQLLARLHVGSCIIEEPDREIPAEVDGGLRQMLFGVKNYAELLISSPTEAKENVVYRFFDEYLCRYIFFRIPHADKDSYFFVGPYLTQLPTKEFVAKKTAQLSLDATREEHLYAYYRHLPIVEEENVLFAIIDTLGEALWGSTEHFCIEQIGYEIPDKRRPVYYSETFELPDREEQTLTLEMIEQNYEREQALMDAISRGKLNRVDFIASSVRNQGTEERLPDSLRNRKNYLIIMNTLLRKAAQNGEVHPYHIHRLSSEFAARIEALYSVESGLELQKEMIRRYCLLVREHSLKSYSALVGRVITLISYDLSADLSLRRIAAVMNVNASYLSDTFKHECGETLTAYVNRRRMEAAAYLLSHSETNVGAVAEACGVLDVNYFIKLFKKQYGVTPAQYRNTVTRGNQ